MHVEQHVHCVAQKLQIDHHIVDYFTNSVYVESNAYVYT